MAVKTANVITRVETEIKEKAESIMEQLGILLSLTIPEVPMALDEMSKAEFVSVMEEGLRQAKAGEAQPAREVFAELRQRI